MIIKKQPSKSKLAHLTAPLLVFKIDKPTEEREDFFGRWLKEMNNPFNMPVLSIPEDAAVTHVQKIKGSIRKRKKICLKD